MPLRAVPRSPGGHYYGEPTVLERGDIYVLAHPPTDGMRNLSAQHQSLSAIGIISHISNGGDVVPACCSPVAIFDMP